MHRDTTSTDAQLWAEFYQFLSCIALMCVGAFGLVCLI